MLVKAEPAAELVAGRVGSSLVTSQSRFRSSTRPAVRRPPSTSTASTIPATAPPPSDLPGLLGTAVVLAPLVGWLCSVVWVGGSVGHLVVGGCSVGYLVVGLLWVGPSVGCVGLLVGLTVVWGTKDIQFNNKISLLFLTLICHADPAFSILADRVVPLGSLVVSLHTFLLYRVGLPRQPELKIEGRAVHPAEGSVSAPRQSSPEILATIFTQSYGAGGLCCT